MECYTQQNHEEYRGSGSFALAIQGIKNLNAVGIRPWIAFVNKSGGGVDGRRAQLLETDFRQRLGVDYGLEIAGLKIIAAYSKGRFFGQVDFRVEPEKVAERINSVQCNYGLAVSKVGVFPLVRSESFRVPSWLMCLGPNFPGLYRRLCGRQSLWTMIFAVVVLLQVLAADNRWRLGWRKVLYFVEYYFYHAKH